MIHVYKTGVHAHRTPLSYPALAPVFEGDIQLVDHPKAADLYVFAHILDIQNAGREIVEDWRRRQVPIVLLSEEPFWDTIWGKHPLAHILYVETAYGVLPAYQLSHQTSDIFRFDHIPYYLLTNPRFAQAYAARFARNARLDVDAWRSAFACRAKHISFMFERRPEPHHWVTWPEANLIGLCSWRTELAEACTGPGVERLGHTWDGSKPRQALHDWYHDKLTKLDAHARYIGAHENTHQPNYITEKLFDAFACGAVPLYYAAPDHRVHELDLPPDSWINSYGHTPPEAAATITRHNITPQICTAYVTAQQALARRFSAPALFDHERARLRTALVAAFERILA